MSEWIVLLFINVALLFVAGLIFKMGHDAEKGMREILADVAKRKAAVRA